MSANPQAPRLFSLSPDEPRPIAMVDPDFRKTTGIFPSQGINKLIEAKEVDAIGGVKPDQVQPASLDLRLGARAYRVQASFLPQKYTVMDRVKQLDGLPAIDLTQPTVLEKGAVYVIELMESLQLTNGTEATANPKSSTGRLDVLTRLITDFSTAFDQVTPRYKGPLYVEVAPLSFSVVVRQGTRLNQMRFYKGKPELTQIEVGRLYAEGQLSRSPFDVPPPLRGDLVPVSVDLGVDGKKIFGFKAKKNSKKIDFDRIRYYNPTEFWEPIHSEHGQLNLARDDFYILATREEIGVPPHLAAEMVPYDPSSGEFRVHYAGFFDPGFGWKDGTAGGSKAVLEVRSHGVAFTLEHGQVVGWLRYSEIGMGAPDKIYGESIKSNYQGQGLALAKQFRPWPRRY